MSNKKKHKLPKHVIICGTRFAVREVDDLGHDDTNYYGYIDHMERYIELEKKMKPDVKVQALIHEMMHSLLLQTGQGGYDWEERIAQMLGCQLPRLLRDNPDLLKVIMDKDI